MTETARATYRKPDLCLDLQEAPILLVECQVVYEERFDAVEALAQAPPAPQSGQLQGKPGNSVHSAPTCHDLVNRVLVFCGAAYLVLW